jgi:hypothetical protein
MNGWINQIHGTLPNGATYRHTRVSRSENIMHIFEAKQKSIGIDPRRGAVGQERPHWYSVANLSVESNGLDVSDGGGGDPVHVVVPNGNYRLM